jgi:hypothetical protein
MTKEKKFFMDELDFIEQQLMQKSVFKEWIDEQFATLGSEAHRPSLEELFQKNEKILSDEDRASIEDIIEFGSMACTPIQYTTIIYYLASFIEGEEEAEKYKKKVWCDTLFGLMKGLYPVNERITDLRAELRSRRKVFSIEKIHSALDGLRQDFGDMVGVSLDKVEEELKLFEESNGENVFVVSNRHVRIMQMLGSNPQPTIEKMAYRLQCSAKTISSELMDLSKVGKIKKVSGEDNNDCWEVVDTRYMTK